MEMGKVSKRQQPGHRADNSRRSPIAYPSTSGLTLCFVGYVFSAFSTDFNYSYLICCYVTPLCQVLAGLPPSKTCTLFELWWVVNSDSLAFIAISIFLYIMTMITVEGCCFDLIQAIDNGCSIHTSKCELFRLIPSYVLQPE